MLHKSISLQILFLFLLILLSMGGCSTVSISNLHTQAANNGQTQLSQLKSFALCPTNTNQPFSEMLVLDTVKNNLLAQGFVQIEENPDFLVLVNSSQGYYAQSHLAPYAMAPGWPYPSLGSRRYGGKHNWPGDSWLGLSQPSRSYTVIKNYVALSIMFVRPNIFKQTENSSSDLDFNSLAPTRLAPTRLAPTRLALDEKTTQISEADILWQGQGVSESSRNAFTTLSCLAAGILEEFPKNSHQESKSIKLNKCY